MGDDDRKEDLVDDEAEDGADDADADAAGDDADEGDSGLAASSDLLTGSRSSSARARSKERRRKAARDREREAELAEAAAKKRNVERVVLVVGGLVVGAAVSFFVTRATLKNASATTAAAAGDAGADGAVAALDPAALGGDAGALPEDLGDPLAARAAAAASGQDDRANATGIGSRMPDGSPVPALPATAPRVVRFGVVLVTYAGAQGAPPTARPKNDALAQAQQLAGDAKSDFHGAVAKGDPGSADDAGRVPRGVLELAPEYFLFNLPRGGVSDPIDTPRGYWIVKRLE